MRLAAQKIPGLGTLMSITSLNSELFVGDDKKPD